MKLIKVEEIDSHNIQYINPNRIAFLEKIESYEKEILTRIYFEYNFFITVYDSIESIIKQLKNI